MTTKPRIKLPETIKSGEVIEVKALIQHVMETGNRKDGQGNTIPRNIIHTVKATFEGQPVFSAELGSGIAANPFLAFHMRVPGPGELEVTWIDDGGVTVVEKARIEVQPATSQ
jgi:sulfur-oxidizing protein SoxZ